MKKNELNNIKKEVKKELQKEIQVQKKEIRDQKKEVAVQKKEIKEHIKEVKILKAEEKRLRKRLQAHAETYVSEMKKALSTAILAAFAFLMALSWREYINEWINSILYYSPLQGKLITALIVTLVSVVGIIIVTRTLSVKEG